MSRAKPHSFTAERAILGCALACGIDAVTEMANYVSVSDFYGETTRITWEAMVRLRDANRSVDLITVREMLADMKALELVGGDGFLLELDGQYAISPPREYAERVRELADRRRTITTYEAIVDMGYDITVPAKQFLDQAEASVFALTSATTTSAIRVSSAQESMVAFFERSIQIKAAGGYIGVKTGIASLDAMLGCFWSEELTCIGGRPSMGKTALLGTVCANAVGSGRRAMFISAEMSEALLWPHLLAKVSDVNASAIKCQTLSPDEVKRVGAAAKLFVDSGFRIVGTPGLSITQIRSIVRREVRQNGIEVVYVDYLQKIHGSRHYERRDLEISEVSSGLADMARELRIPVVVGAQVNRGVANRSDKRPMISDLRESGSIENDSDAVVLIHRPGYYVHEEARANGRDVIADVGATELIVGKNRNGSTGIANARFKAHLTRFDDDEPTQNMQHWGNS